jgi:hypothetical protein
MSVNCNLMKLDNSSLKQSKSLKSMNKDLEWNSERINELILINLRRLVSNED